jgi:apolipoprotein N-acyltransferase
MSAVQEDDAERALRRQFTADLGVPALFGSVLVRPVDDARQYVLFNSALLTDKRGKVLGRFDKQLLLAFGEYLPFGETFPILYEWSPHTGHFQAGASFKPLSLGERQIAVVICYEDVLPNFVNRVMSEGDPELIANLTNDAWFGDSTEPWIHLALAKLRAVEHRKFFVRSTNSGVSAFVDPAGRVISNTKTFEEEAHPRFHGIPEHGHHLLGPCGRHSMVLGRLLLFPSAHESYVSRPPDRLHTRRLLNGRL